MRRSLTVLALLSGCATSGSNRAADDGRLTAARLFPMEVGHLWSYHIDTGTPLPALGILRVVSARDGVYEIRPDGGVPMRYRRTDEGIELVDEPGAFVLHEPIEVGTRFRGRAGRSARIAETGIEIETAAGRFTGCVQVDELDPGDARDQSTIYCPGVGPVVVESSGVAAPGEARARVQALLLGYGAPGE